ncbi:MAG: hypothetical protein ACFB51_06000 [Anaerolineae bacterium]
MAEANVVPYEETKIYRIRHSLAHVMAQAVLEKFPEAKLAIGPPVDDGFYYDFDLPRTLTPEDLEEIEKRMKEIIKGNHEFTRKEVSAEEARAIFSDQPYKLELIDGLMEPDEFGYYIDENGEETKEPPTISTYTQDTFEDLCRGPHVEHTGQLPRTAFQLDRVSGAYWRGDESRPMLQRIYGLAFEDKKDLKAYLKQREEARQRDHR